MITDGRHVAQPPAGRPQMMALATIGFCLGVMAFTVGLVLFLMGGPTYRKN